MNITIIFLTQRDVFTTFIHLQQITDSTSILSIIKPIHNKEK